MTSRETGLRMIPKVTSRSTTCMTGSFSGNKLTTLPNFRCSGGKEFSWMTAKSPTCMTFFAWCSKGRDVSCKRYSLDHRAQNCFLSWKKRPYVEDKLKSRLVNLIFLSESSNKGALQADCFLSLKIRLIATIYCFFFTDLFLLNCRISSENSASCISFDYSLFWMDCFLRLQWFS